MCDLPCFNTREEARAFYRGENLVRGREAVLAAAYDCCRLHLSDKARDYLRSRGITDEGARLLGIGQYPTVAEVRRYCEARGLDRWLVGFSGVLCHGLVGYITFPWLDEEGSPLTIYGAWGHGDPPKRRGGEAGPRKYALPNPEWTGRTLHTKHALLGLYDALLAGHRQVVFVEGLLDYAVLRQAGETNVVSPVAASFSADQLRGLVHYGIRAVTLVNDSDGGGVGGQLTCFRQLTEAGIEVRVPPWLPRGVDPDEFVLRNGIDAWREHVESAKVVKSEEELPELLDDDGEAVRPKAAARALGRGTAYEGAPPVPADDALLQRFRHSWEKFPPQIGGRGLGFDGRKSFLGSCRAYGASDEELDRLALAWAAKCNPPHPAHQALATARWMKQMPPGRSTPGGDDKPKGRPDEFCLRTRRALWEEGDTIDDGLTRCKDAVNCKACRDYLGRKYTEHFHAAFDRLAASHRTFWVLPHVPEDDKARWGKVTRAVRKLGGVYVQPLGGRMVIVTPPAADPRKALPDARPATVEEAQGAGAEDLAKAQPARRHQPMVRMSKPLGMKQGTKKPKPQKGAGGAPLPEGQEGQGCQEPKKRVWLGVPKTVDQEQTKDFLRRLGVGFTVILPFDVAGVIDVRLSDVVTEPLTPLGLSVVKQALLSGKLPSEVFYGQGKHPTHSFRPLTARDEQNRPPARGDPFKESG